MKVAIVIEKSKTGFSAYSPDFPGCVAAARTRKRVEREMRDALAFHVEGLKRAGEPVAPPHSYVTYVDVSS